MTLTACKLARLRGWEVRYLFLFASMFLGLLVAVIHFCGGPKDVAGNLGIAAGISLMAYLAFPDRSDE